MCSHGPLAEDRVDEWEDDEETAGLSVVPVLESFAAGEEVSDVDALLSDWQEAQAIADDGSKPMPSISDQEAMMASWRVLVESKERELRRTQRRELAKVFDGSWAPAHLTGWWTDDDDNADASKTLRSRRRSRQRRRRRALSRRTRNSWRRGVPTRRRSGSGGIGALRAPSSPHAPDSPPPGPQTSPISGMTSWLFQARGWTERREADGRVGGGAGDRHRPRH